MKSEFYNVALDRVRYSLVWEDSATLYKALDIQSTDHVLVVTSAGCNALNALLKSPASLTAIDLNPVQNRLLLFKKHIITHHEHATLRALLGLDGEAAVALARPGVEASLPPAERSFWASFFDAHPEGLLGSGRLEAYITGFYHTLNGDLQQKLQRLLQFTDVAQQADYFRRELHDTPFREQFIRYFDDENLSKGRDPELFKYAAESGGTTFYWRLLQQVTSTLVRDNFYFRFFFFGPCGLPEELLPPCYQQKHFAPLQEQLHKLQVVTGEAVDYLLSPEGQRFNKASLSNIFEYTSREEFRRVCHSLYQHRDLSIVFWNLLNQQGEEPIGSPSITPIDASPGSCFYFHNVCLLTPGAASPHNHTAMQPDYFQPSFVERLMRQYAPEQNIRVLETTLFNVDNSASILAALTAGRTGQMIGHFGLAVTYEAAGQRHHRPMVMKIKPHGNAIVDMLSSLAKGCSNELSVVYDRYKSLTGFQYTHLREQEIYTRLAPAMTPEIFGVYTNEESGVYIILMEYLQDVELLNSVMAPERWTDRHLRVALREMAAWHAAQLNKRTNLDMTLWPDAPSLSYMTHLQPLWQALLESAAQKFPGLYTTDRVALLQEAINDLPRHWQHLEHLPKTLVHNDFNPRNSCFKNHGTLRFCLYDWELATFHIPQYDLVEFLCFVLDEDRYALRESYIEYYRQQLRALTGNYTDPVAFRNDLELAAYDFALHRLGMYMMAHAVSPYPFLPRVVNSLFSLLTREEQLATVREQVREE